MLAIDVALQRAVAELHTLFPFLFRFVVSRWVLLRLLQLTLGALVPGRWKRCAATVRALAHAAVLAWLVQQARGHAPAVDDACAPYTDTHGQGVVVTLAGAVIVAYNGLVASALALSALMAVAVYSSFGVVAACAATVAAASGDRALVVACAATTAVATYWNVTCFDKNDLTRTNAPSLVLLITTARMSVAAARMGWATVRWCCCCCGLSRPTARAGRSSRQADRSTTPPPVDAPAPPAARAPESAVRRALRRRAAAQPRPACTPTVPTPRRRRSGPP